MSIMISITTTASMLPQYNCIHKKNIPGYLINHTDTLSSDAPYTITRRQAVIDYLIALYSENDGAFHAYLTDPPTFPKEGRVPAISDVLRPFRVFERLKATSILNWSACRKFLKQLVNIDPKTAWNYGLVNYSTQMGTGVIPCENAVELFPKLELSDWLYKEQIAEFIMSAQNPDGGFTEYPPSNNPSEKRSNLIVTWTALSALKMLHRLYLVDTRAALDYVLSCYHEDGGFSNVPTADSDFSYVPLGLISLNILGKFNLVDVSKTTEYILQFWDSYKSWGKGPAYGIVAVERIIWSLSMMGTLDNIDVNKTVSNVLKCQTYYNGAFLGDLIGSPEEERLIWSEAATHTIEILGRLDALDENITILHHPKYTIPQWWIDHINKEYGNNTTTNIPHFYIGTVDVLAILSDWSTPLTFSVLAAIPILYIHYQNSQQRKARRERLKRRKRKR